MEKPKQLIDISYCLCSGQGRTLSLDVITCAVGYCKGIDAPKGSNATNCCDTCCGCCSQSDLFFGCTGPCWGCGASKPTPAQCASKPKSDPKCVCHPKGVAHFPFQCYTCAGGACNGAKCYECGPFCVRKPNFSAQWDGSHRWKGSTSFIKNVTTTLAKGCAKACNKQAGCWKWNENGQGIMLGLVPVPILVPTSPSKVPTVPAPVPLMKINKVCSLYKDSAKLVPKSGGVAGKLWYPVSVLPFDT